MKIGPKERQTRLLGPSTLERQYASQLRAGYTERKPVTKAVTKRDAPVTKNLSKRDATVTTVTKAVTSVTPVTKERDAPMSQAERARAYRARKKGT